MAVCGLDVSKDSLEYSAGDMKGAVANTEDGVRQLFELLTSAQIELVVMEATGGCERLVRDELHERGLDVAVINPRRVRAFADALGELAKTDGIDASVLARYGDVMDCDPWQPPSAERQMLRQLVRRRDQLIGDKTREQNRRKRASEFACESIDLVLTTLSKEVKRIDQMIKQLLNSDELRAQAQRLMSIPGVAMTIAAVIIAEFPELGAISSRQAGALAGVVPYANDSGAFTGKRRPRGGRPRLRHALYMAVLVGLRFNPAVKAHYTQLVARGKLKKVAMVACMNKLTGWLNAMEREGLEWSQMKTAKSVS